APRRERGGTIDATSCGRDRSVSARTNPIRADVRWSTPRRDRARHARGARGGSLQARVRASDKNGYAARET
ncbi:MAG: hypothetical protein AB7N90_09870, partial [Vicinamibacterales bacterium]